MEHLSNVILRSHSILTLFDRDRFQLEYFDRSVIAVSTAVDLSTEAGQTLFILMVYGLRRLSPEDLGLRTVVKDSLKLCTDYESTAKRLEEKASGIGANNVEYTLKDIVFRQPGLIGRSTCVVAARRSTDDKHFVVKFSCPARTRATEMELIQKARVCAESDEEHAWVLSHLLNMIAKGSVQARMRDFLDNAVYADEKKYYYEDRCLRICVSEELFPITNLTSQRKIAQVFLDILQTHKWLYDFPKILHRDLSMSNIMFREDELGHVFGVPNDLDLASLLSELESGTSLRRTGTPPFMALDLQNPHKLQVRHLYRHDLESLFYVLLMLVCRHDFTRKKKQTTVQRLVRLRAILVGPQKDQGRLLPGHQRRLYQSSNRPRI
ncbi:hypothetical protein CPB85DRAFT_1316785 [Mucidula mucida]|nr:hypothetical protein CPB85DRAFT_1316785 [Mucidula mucida]